MKDWGAILKAIESFVKNAVDDSGAVGAVIGVSGGIDSACVLSICQRAIGSENVMGIIMPEEDITPVEDIEDAFQLCKSLGVDYKVVKINAMVESFTEILGNGNDTDIARANLRPRIRMTILYYHANAYNRLVVGTGNKTELTVGYFTKYGDGGVDILPIGDLFKTEIFDFARYLGIPKKIIEKKPSAGLWKGQTDEEEIGITYSELDKILKAIENGEKEGDKNFRLVWELVKKSDHKRQMPPIAQLRQFL